MGGHRDIIIRQAKNDDGPAVAALMQKDETLQYADWDIDWSELEPHWLAAELDGEIIGVIQVIPAKPIGRMECLVVDPDLLLLTRGATVKLLTDNAILVNKMYGAQAVASSIPYELQDYFGHAQSRKWIELGQGWIIMRRVV